MQRRCTAGTNGHAATNSQRGAPAFLARRHAKINVQAASTAAQYALQQQQHAVDVVALGNLCVDVLLPVPELPAPDTATRRELLQQLALVGPQARSAWEVGGNCNFMIAAARLGLGVSSVGHVGHDIYGAWMADVLQAESIPSMERILSPDAPPGTSSTNSSTNESATPPSQVPSLDDVRQTLVCYVLVDPHSRHAFCSRYDFGPWPLLGGMSHLPPSSVQASRAVFTNGFVFDELPLEVVRDACTRAIRQGTAVFFDPGPRCFTMMEGQRRQALDELISLSEVVLMTEEEAVTVTGLTDPEQAARAILARPLGRTQWCVVKLGARGALLVDRSTGKVHAAPGFKVQVADTVGCGDSFAAAIVKGYLARATPEVVLTLANAVGAATATGRGAGRNVASASKVEQLLRSAAVEQSSGCEPVRRQQVQAALALLHASPGAGFESASAAASSSKLATGVH